MIFFRSILSGYTYRIPIGWHFFRIGASEISTKPRPRSFSSSKQLGSAEQLLQTNSVADFIRFKKVDGGVDGGVTAELQTAVVSYRKRLPFSHLGHFLQVDLVSTIHMADKEYFATLQKELETYDCVLYEMVASREYLKNRRKATTTKRLKGSRSIGFDILGCIERRMVRVLMLDLQSDCLGCQAENWYHADLDYETFKLLQIEKGESFFTFARDMNLLSTKVMVQPPSIPEDLDPWRSKLLWASCVLPMPLVGLLIIGSEYPELEALSRLDLGAARKVFWAKRLTSAFTQVTADVEEGSVIVGERNRIALEALRRAMDEGNYRIAILYGAAHMPDLGRRLRVEFDLIPNRVQWITAWSIRNRVLNSTSSLFLTKLPLLIFSSVLAIDLWFCELFFNYVVNWILRSI